MNKLVTKVLIADDHDLIRQGLKTLIGFEEDLKVVAEAENGLKALELFNQNKPDILLLDVNMPVVNGIEVLKRVRNGATSVKIIMLTVENDRKTIHDAINTGADGYILKDSAGTEIINAIRTVQSGEKYIDRALVSILFSDIKSSMNREKSVLDELSKREMDVLLKISKGFSNKEIAEQLFLSEKTVKNYATSLFMKINAHDRVQATIIALQNNIEGYYAMKYENDK